MIINNLDTILSAPSLNFLGFLVNIATSTPEDVLANFGLGKDTFAELISSLTADARSILQDKLLYSKPSIDMIKLTDDFKDHLLSFCFC